ncbi:MAG: hypothetical protein GY707_02940, partial [Desulfobacteraceae bacterium]|nr:hypothetical protein [Desulfobacteraceae bacterium]
AFSINSAALVNAGPKIKDSKIITKTSKPAKSLPTKKKSPRTLQRNNPIILKQGKKVLLKFSTKVNKITLFDHKSRKIASFPGGNVFDITKIIKKVKGEKLRIHYHSPNPTNKSIGGLSDPMSEIIKYAKIPRGLFKNPRFAIVHPGDRNEPANNSINNAVAVSARNVQGTVGVVDDVYDPDDYLSYTTPAGGFGYYVEVSKISGNIYLSTYDPVKRGLSSRDRNKLWLSLAPNTTFYIGIEPVSSSGKTEYTINISIKTINDLLEPNDNLAQAKPYTLPGTKYLCNVITSAGYSVSNTRGMWDTYKIEGVHGGQNVIVNLTGAGLPGDEIELGTVTGVVLDEGGTPLDSDGIEIHRGTKDGVSFT